MTFSDEGRREGERERDRLREKEGEMRRIVPVGVVQNYISKLGKMGSTLGKMESKKENTRNIKKMESVLRLKKRITVSKHAITSNKMQSNFKKAISVHTNNEEDRRHR